MDEISLNWSHEWTHRELGFMDMVATSEVTYKSKAISLEDVIGDFELYLKACGFILEGAHLELVEDEDEEDGDDEEEVDDPDEGEEEAEE